MAALCTAAPEFAAQNQFSTSIRPIEVVIIRFRIRLDVAAFQVARAVMDHLGPERTVHLEMDWVWWWRV